MVTAIKRKRHLVTTHRTAYPEIPGLPSKMRGICPFLHGVTEVWPPGMPVIVQEAINKAIPIFGMTIQVFYPEKVGTSLAWDQSQIWESKDDPLVIGQKDGKFYLIAAWE